MLSINNSKCINAMIITVKSIMQMRRQYNTISYIVRVLNNIPYSFITLWPWFHNVLIVLNSFCDDVTLSMCCQIYEWDCDAVFSSFKIPVHWSGL